MREREAGIPARAGARSRRRFPASPVRIACSHDAKGVPFIRVVGELDLSNADQLDAAIERATAERPEGIVIDLSGVTFMDSTGLHALFKARKRADTITLRAPSREARRVIELSGLDSVARIER